MTFHTRRAVHRFAALVLLGVAALRGGIPVLDGLIRHRGDAPERLGIHLDRLGGCSSHAEHCVLRAADSGQRFTRPDAVRAVPSAPIVPRHSGARDLAAGRRANPSNHSRAPPIPLV